MGRRKLGALRAAHRGAARRAGMVTGPLRALAGRHLGSPPAAGHRRAPSRLGVTRALADDVRTDQSQLSIVWRAGQLTTSSTMHFTTWAGATRLRTSGGQSGGYTSLLLSSCRRRWAQWRSQRGMRGPLVLSVMR